jgi:enterochelin esterase family protein
MVNIDLQFLVFMSMNCPAVETISTLNPMLLCKDVGSALWWETVAETGAPLIEDLGASARVTFLWRDPGGVQSALCRVYVDVNSVTNHHSFAPQTLTRWSGTDVWYWQTELPANWHGSYAFIPVMAGHLPPPEQGFQAIRIARQRLWWRGIQQFAVSDELNIRPALTTPSGQQLSPLYLPAAPDDALWRSSLGGASSPQVWESQRLGNARKIWFHVTGPQDADRALVLVLDGQRWAENLGLMPVLDALTEAGRLPPAAYVLIDSLDGETRSCELPCNAEFWLAVQEELLPMAREQMCFTDDPARSVVAGQSFGGLAAMYAGLMWPQRFGCVLSQSGSFWWPKVELLDTGGDLHARRPGSRGGLMDLVAESKGPLRVFMEVGQGEGVMQDVNEHQCHALRRLGHDVQFRTFAGGHDWVCWRHGLIDGLSVLLNPA